MKVWRLCRCYVWTCVPDYSCDHCPRCGDALEGWFDNPTDALTHFRQVHGTDPLPFNLKGTP